MPKLKFDSLIIDFLNSKNFKDLQIGNFVSSKDLKYIERPYSILKLVEFRGTHGRSRLYLKVFINHYNKPEEIFVNEIKTEFKTIQFWHNKFKNQKRFRVVEGIYCLPERHFMIIKESEGDNLLKLIQKRGKFYSSQNSKNNLLKAVNSVGEWLSCFQKIPIGKKYMEINLKSFIDYINIRLIRIQTNDKINFDESLGKKINQYLENEWKKIKNENKNQCYIHGDFSLTNVLVDNNIITVLDFDTIESGSIYKDVSRFYHQMELLENKPVFKKSYIKKLQKSFLKGYGNGDIDKHPLFKIFYMIHSINHLGKNARYNEHSFPENLYNRYVVNNALKKIKSMI